MESVERFASLFDPKYQSKQLVTISTNDWNNQEDTTEIIYYGVTYNSKSMFKIADEMEHNNKELHKIVRISLRNNSKQHYFITKSDADKIEQLKKDYIDEYTNTFIDCYEFNKIENQQITIYSTPIPVLADNISLES